MLDLTVRANGIGASEVGILFGLDKYTSKAMLYEIKCGTYTKPQIDNEYTLAGKLAEPIIQQLYEHGHFKSENDIDIIKTADNLVNNKKNRTIEPHQETLFSDSYPYLFATPDFRIIESNRHEGQGLLEAKTIGEQVSAQWESGVPMQYILQVQAQMIVTGADYVELAVYIGGHRFRSFVIQVDPTLQSKIIREAEAFWKLVEQGNQPEQDYVVKGFEDYLKATTQDNGVIVSGYDTEAGLEVQGLAEEEAEIDKQCKELDQRKTALRNEIKLKIGNLTGFEYDGIKVTWKEAKNGVRYYKNGFTKQEN